MTEDIRNMIDMHEDEGDLHKDESEMINAILDLKEITVEKIMTYRKNIFSLNLNETKKYTQLLLPARLVEYLYGGMTQIIFWALFTPKYFINLDDDGKNV